MACDDCGAARAHTFELAAHRGRSYRVSAKYGTLKTRTMILCEECTRKRVTQNQPHHAKQIINFMEAFLWTDNNAAVHTKES